MLALVIRDLTHVASPADALPSLLPLLRKRALVASADTAALDAWSAKLVSMLHAPSPSTRVAITIFLRETIQQCTQASFSRHREAWTAPLVNLLQPTKHDQHDNDSVRLAAAETLVQMISVTGPWPSERRELLAVVSRLATALVGMLSEPATQSAALSTLSTLCRAAPHSMRAHRDKLGTLLPAIVLDAPLPTARAACGLLGALPSCVPHAQVADSWLLTVQSLCGTLNAALTLLLGAVTSQRALVYELPSHTLPADATAHGAHLAASRRHALLRCVRRVALALHGCLCPTGACWDHEATSRSGGGDGGASERAPGILPVPIGMLIQLATHALSTDGVLALRTPPETCLPHAEVRLVLAEVHVASLQLLHSTLLATRRHALSHAHALAAHVKACLKRSGDNGPPHLRDTTLRAGAYALASTMLHVLGPCVVPLLAEPLVAAARTDLPSPPALAAAEEPPAGKGGSGGGKRQRTVGGTAESGRPALECSTDALGALHALMLHGVELVPLALLGTIQRLLLHVSVPTAAAPLPAAALATSIEALRASVGTGRATHTDVLPRAIAIFQHWAVRGDVRPRAASQAALHSLDALLHPAGLLVWGASADSEAVAAVASSGGNNGAYAGALGAVSHLLSASSQATTFLPGPAAAAAVAPTILQNVPPPAMVLPSLPPLPPPPAAPTLAAARPAVVLPPPTTAPPAAAVAAPALVASTSVPAAPRATRATAPAPAPAPAPTPAPAQADDDSDSDVDIVDVGPDDDDRAGQ